MLSPAQAGRQRRRRSPPSLKQQYQEYILQRVEGFKNSIGREELLRLGDEAVAELSATVEGQFVLTEVLMLDSVDRLIMKRLRLRSYRRWREQNLKLRVAQRVPTHWGIDGRSPVARLLARLEPGDGALVVGTGAASAACLLAAHDVAVTFLADDLHVVDQVESRVAGEALAGQFSAYVVWPGGWLPEVEHEVNVVVLDTGILAGSSARARTHLITSLQHLTTPEGMHVLLPGERSPSAEPYLAHYAEWTREVRRGERKPGSAQAGGVLVIKPACRVDTPADVSEQHEA